MSAWRDSFPFLAAESLAFLDSAASAQKPAVVLEAMKIFAQTRYANIHRGVHTLAEASTAAYENARAAVANFIGAADPAEIVFTSGTTAAVNLAAYSLLESGRLAGGAIVATQLEHHSNFLPWQRAAAKADRKFIVAPVQKNGELDTEKLKEIFKKEKVSLLAITHVSNVLGTVVPLQEIIALAHAEGALVFVDGAQAVAHLPVNVAQLGADFYAFSGHKLYGPTGIGALYMRPALAAQLPPAALGGGMVARVGETFQNTTWAPPPYRFEAGTPPIVEAVGLHEAINFVSSIGFEKISAHERELGKYLFEKISAVPGIKIYGPPPQHIGVFSFNLGDIHPHDVGSILSAQGVAVRVGHHCAQPLMAALGIQGCVRASLGLYNTHADIDRLAAALVLAHQKLS